MIESGLVVSTTMPNSIFAVHYAGERVYVCFDPEELQWIFSLEDGTEIRSRPAVEITGTQIRRLDVTNRRSGHLRRPK